MLQFKFQEGRNTGTHSFVLLQRLHFNKPKIIRSSCEKLNSILYLRLYLEYLYLSFVYTIQSHRSWAFITSLQFDLTSYYSSCIKHKTSSIFAYVKFVPSPYKKEHTGTLYRPQPKAINKKKSSRQFFITQVQPQPAGIKFILTLFEN